MLENDKKIMGERLLAIRTRLGYNQRDFSKDLQVNQRDISEWETGKRILSTKFMLKVCRKFRVPFEFFNPDNKDPDSIWK